MTKTIQTGNISTFKTCGLFFRNNSSNLLKYAVSSKRASGNLQMQTQVDQYPTTISAKKHASSHHILDIKPNRLNLRCLNHFNERAKCHSSTPYCCQPKKNKNNMTKKHDFTIPGEMRSNAAISNCFVYIPGYGTWSLYPWVWR